MPDMLENRMVVGWQWPDMQNAMKEASSRLRGPGYREIETNIFVPEDDAFSYALERLLQDKDLQNEFLGLFYSGDYWIKEE